MVEIYSRYRIIVVVPMKMDGYARLLLLSWDEWSKL